MKNPSSFEEAVSRLEAVIARMESGEEDLDKTVASFEEGRRLVDYCNRKALLADECDAVINRIVFVLLEESYVEAALLPDLYSLTSCNECSACCDVGRG